MSDATATVLARLSALGFDARAGGLAPFDEQLPLVSGVAWDQDTGQVAVLAELDGDESDEAVRQLLFAAAGLRHQVAGAGPAAFGAPVVLAIVDEEGERRLRVLSEELAARYALFDRVDLNLVPRSVLDDQEALDFVLAPLLPKCRELLGVAISREEIEWFWKVLRIEIQRAAQALDDRFGAYRESAGRDSAEALVGDLLDRPELDAPWPVSSIGMRNFRSFASEDVELHPVTVIHGPNGGGKTSIVEALELGWAGRSQRHPADVEPDEYERHLARNGAEGFEIECDGQRVSAVEDAPLAELARCVLGQDSLSRLVADAPVERYRALLTLIGLEIPDLSVRTENLLDATKAEADAALVAAGLGRLPRRDTVAMRHLERALESGFGERLPATADLVALQDDVAAAAEGTFRGWVWPDEAAIGPLAQADAAVAGVLGGSSEPAEVAAALDDARVAVDSLTKARQGAATAIRALLDATGAHAPSAPPRTDPVPGAIGLELDVAVRWSAHGRGLTETAVQFRDEAAGQAEPWAELLVEYASALDRAAAVVPRDELTSIVRASPVREPSAVRLPAPQQRLYTNAGFLAAPPDPSAVAPTLRALLNELERQADALLGLRASLESHPARAFGEHAPRVLRALCRFELARVLRRGKPIVRASEQLVEELLQERLAPILAELVAAIVRFEWYFKRLEVPPSSGAVVIGGVATARPDLDARLVLNAAEGTVVGLAWFLALHLLQPKERRQVLVLDDPTGAFDLANQAGFVSTLRAFVRLTRPELVVLTTRDDMLAAVIAEELAPVDDWPAGVARIRCQRDGVDASFARVEWSTSSSRGTAEESESLRLSRD